jgi:hypothetical protein
MWYAYASRRRTILRQCACVACNVPGEIRSMPKKLPGRYKGTRKRSLPPVFVKIECPGCGWKSKAVNSEKMQPAEKEYVHHLTSVHYGLLECAFCDDTVSIGLRCLPTFATLAQHVRHFHADKLERIEKDRGYPVEPRSVPAHAFKDEDIPF